MARRRPSTIRTWPEPFDPDAELDWSRPDYSRRLLREHLDQSHDGASRRLGVVDAHLRRLRRLLPFPPSRILDAACGPGLYALPLAAAGHDVTGVDVSPAALRYARAAARQQPGLALRYRRGDLRALPAPRLPYDAALLIYFVLEAFPRAEQPGVLRRLAACLRPGGVLVVEMRLRPDQLPGRLEWWSVVERSVLHDRRHLLLGDTTYDKRRNTYVLREMAVLDDGRVLTQQTSAWLCPFERMPALFRRGGFDIAHRWDGWSAEPASPLSDTVLVVARRRG